ncbi:hypothetical protein SCHIN_v1c08250 [Spiroplasma chinense]|uniref:Uncharacterized protein n=1 Tax=Spiroplasma chinense TaxID=216932 RepID=A0A5B9Y4Y6_9MOLU|nr:hypothetical protein [Spiroplasma chinense]QEH62020.1 hypothetical protein SCHIN_v1c08250 [Spiroplasma chinense]
MHKEIQLTTKENQPTLKRLNIIYRLNLKLALRNKGIIATGCVFVLMSLLFVFIMTLMGKNLTESFVNFNMMKGIYYLIVGFFFTIFLTLISFFFFKKQKDDGVHNIELRAGIKTWISYLYRYSQAIIIAYIYVTINLLLSAVIAGPAGLVGSLFSRGIMIICAFYYFLPLAYFPIVALVTMICSAAIGILFNILIALCVFFYPFTMGLTQSIVSGEEKGESISRLNLGLSAGAEFYNTFKDDVNLKNIFTDKEYAEKISTLSSGSGKGIWGKNLYAGQINYSLSNPEDNFYYGTEILNVFNKIEQQSKNISSYIDYLTLKNKNWGVVSSGYSSKPFTIDIKPQINNLKKSLPEYASLFDFIYEKYAVETPMYFAGVSGSYSSGYFEISSNLDELFSRASLTWNQEEPENNLDYYKEHPEVMLINAAISNYYRISVRSINAVEYLSNYDDSKDVTNEVYIQRYENFFKSSNRSANLNFLNNFFLIFFGGDKDKFFNDYEKGVSSFMHPAAPLHHFKTEVVEKIVNNYPSTPTNNKTDDISVFNGVDTTVKGGFSIPGAIIAWIAFGIVLGYLDLLVFNKKSRI